MSDEGQLHEDVLALTRELRRLRSGELVARLTEAERDELALRIADELEDRLFPQGRKRQPAAESAPARKTKGRRRRYFQR